jgi:hypothetical protein
LACWVGVWTVRAPTGWTLPEISSIFTTILLFHQLFTSWPSLVELATLTIGK